MKIITKAVLLSLPLMLMACDPNEPSTPDVNITGSGEQSISTGAQMGGVNNLEVNTNGGNVVVEAAGSTSTCPKKMQKDFGVLERNGRVGSMCKAAITTKIKRKKCEKKGGFIYQSYCVMEWQAQGSYWKVRLLKD